MKNKLETAYIEWFNDFLTIGGYADYYHISDERAERIISLGRKLNHRRGAK
jgi:hypothetical protein